MVLLNDENIELTDALECAAVADVLVSSESDFSVASTALSPRVKVSQPCRWSKNYTFLGSGAANQLPM